MATGRRLRRRSALVKKNGERIFCHDFGFVNALGNCFCVIYKKERTLGARATMSEETMCRYCRAWLSADDERELETHCGDCAAAGVPGRAFVSTVQTVVTHLTEQARALTQEVHELREAASGFVYIVHCGGDAFVMATRQAALDVCGEILQGHLQSLHTARVDGEFRTGLQRLRELRPIEHSCEFISSSYSIDRIAFGRQKVHATCPENTLDLIPEQ